MVNLRNGLQWDLPDVDRCHHRLIETTKRLRGTAWKSGKGWGRGRNGKKTRIAEYGEIFGPARGPPVHYTQNTRFPAHQVRRGSRAHDIAFFSESWLSSLNKLLDKESFLVHFCSWKNMKTWFANEVFFLLHEVGWFYIYIWDWFTSSKVKFGFKFVPLVSCVKVIFWDVKPRKLSYIDTCKHSWHLIC